MATPVRMRSLRVFLVLFPFLLSIAVSAQQGTITGVVTALEQGKQEPQPFTSVVVKGTNLRASTGLDGGFSLIAPPGTYTVVASLVGHANIEREITLGTASTVNVVLVFEEGGVQMETVQVVRERRVASEIAVLQAVRNSDQLANAVGREQIAKGQDRTAADVVKRVPGVTLQGDRFVMVRGLADRYNNVLLNGVAAPSMEPDRKAFSFDLLPSGALDRMMVYKSGAPELPGEFAGGIIDLSTMGVPSRNEVKVSYGAGIRSGTTFQELQMDQAGKTDFLGFDDGSRSLPAAFPAHLNTVSNPAQLAGLGRQLPNTWGTSTNMAGPDQRFGILIARRFGKENARNHYGTVTSIDLSNTSSSYTAQNLNYNSFDAASGKNDTIYHFTDRENIRTARLGVMHNWSALIGTGTKLEFRNLFNQVGQNQTTVRTGQNMEAGFDERDFAFRYTQRTLYSGQLQGRHDLMEDRTHLDWTLSYGLALGKEPDYRRIRTVRTIGESDAPFQVVIAPTASTLDAGRFYSDLNERTMTGKLGLARDLGNPDDGKLSAVVRMGGLAERKDRNFSARWMSFRKANSAQFDPALGSLPPTSIFNAANINGTDGFKLEEGTNPSDRYTAANTLIAGYAGTTVKWAKLFVLSGGVRVEHNRQELDGATYGGANVRVDQPLTHVLPSVNASWNITEKSLVRVAWSNSVNRPEFRELAPFSFYDFSTNNVLYGNPALTTATITNLDARWEVYPGLGEVFNVGVFRKDFTNPIEMFFVPGAGSGGTRNFTFRNAQGATSMGAEMEVRRSMASFTGNKFLQRIGVLFNGTVINSTVTLGAQAVGQEQNRPMMGQSPYVLNAGLFYADTAAKFQMNVVFNTFGKRLYAVGSTGTPDIYEMPSQGLDITLGKDFGKHFALKAGLQNLLDPLFLLKQDSDGNGHIGNNDALISSFRRGMYFSAAFTYTL
ncbi:MAG: TonB-dependent receptor [Flavobacteriales bacterium]|nr:TonB-dependent receptor [Flavobacteriales bacterium]